MSTTNLISNVTPKLTRSQQSRINGAKSLGPTSIDGKATSSRKAIKHGFAATINNVISLEDEPDWQLHLAGYRASFLPQCYAEQTLVDQLASINWRQARLVALETALIDSQISIQKDNVCELHPNCAQDPYFHLALAWQAISRQPQRPPIRKEDSEPVDPTIPPDGYDISSIELVRRYLVSLDRQYRNTLMNLRQFRKDFAIQPPKPNEPESPSPPEPPKPRIASPGTPKPSMSAPEATEKSPLPFPEAVQTRPQPARKQTMNPKIKSS